jgi:hypothetical protein
VEWVGPQKVHQGEQVETRGKVSALRILSGLYLGTQRKDYRSKIQLPSHLSPFQHGFGSTIYGVGDTAPQAISCASLRHSF